MTTITIENRKITVHKSLVTRFKETVGCSLETMTELYIAASLKTPNISEELKTMTDEEILSCIRPWIKAEFEMLGVNYAAFQCKAERNSIIQMNLKLIQQNVMCSLKPASHF